MAFPSSTLGCIIGKGGENIKRLREIYTKKIIIDVKPNPDNTTPVTITANRQTIVYILQEMISMLSTTKADVKFLLDKIDALYKDMENPDVIEIVNGNENLRFTFFCFNKNFYLRKSTR